MSAKRIAILATDGFEQSELMEPRRRLKDAGFEVQVVSPKAGEIRGWQHKEWGDTVPVDVRLSEASPEDYVALVLPGGQMNPDALRLEPAAVDFVRAFAVSGKPLAAICHGPWLLVEAGAARGRQVTSWPSLKTDLTNAGAQWRDAPVVEDGALITSRKPDDIPQFTDAVVRALQ
jgi:protease I